MCLLKMVSAADCNLIVPVSHVINKINWPPTLACRRRVSIMMSINDASSSSLQTRMAKIMRMQGGVGGQRAQDDHFLCFIFQRIFTSLRREKALKENAWWPLCAAAYDRTDQKDWPQGPQKNYSMHSVYIYHTYLTHQMPYYVLYKQGGQG